MAFFGVEIGREGSEMPDQHVGFWEWFLYLILESISLLTLPVEIIYSIVSSKRNMKNFAIASLILTGIRVLIGVVILFVVFMSMLMFQTGGGTLV